MREEVNTLSDGSFLHELITKQPDALRCLSCDWFFVLHGKGIENGFGTVNFLGFESVAELLLDELKEQPFSANVRYMKSSGRIYKFHEELSEFLA